MVCSPFFFILMHSVPLFTLIYTVQNKWLLCWFNFDFGFPELKKSTQNFIQCGLCSCNCTECIFMNLTRSRLCATLRPVHHQVQSTCKFYWRLSMPITFGMKGSSYLCSQITGSAENAIHLHVNIFRNCFVKKHTYNDSCTYSTPGTNFHWMASAIMLPFLHQTSTLKSLELDVPVIF
jgi:hypothetical protein